MFKMIIRTIIMILFVILFFYLWKNPQIFKSILGKDSINSQEAERRVNELYNVIEELDLSPENVQDDEFMWGVIEQERQVVEDAVVEVEAKSIRFFDETNELRTKVEEYFEKYGFIIGWYNDVKGFIKDDTVCIVEEEKEDVTVECGELD
ncbi:hypothetical protein ACFL15_02675 [Patescibacteria group bacterium]